MTPTQPPHTHRHTPPTYLGGCEEDLSKGRRGLLHRGHTYTCKTRIKWDVLPELSLGTEENIEVVEELKIVGYIFRSDMKTCSNTAYLTAKAYKRMWFLRRLKSMGASTAQLLDTLEKQVFSVLWLGAPAWFCQLTVVEKRDFNRVAKVGLRIIYGDAIQWV